MAPMRSTFLWTVVAFMLGDSVLIAMNPFSDAFQARLDNDLRELQEGKPHEPAPAAAFTLCWGDEILARGNPQHSFASKTEAENFLASARKSMEREKGRLSILIPQAKTVSDVLRAVADNLYGYFDPEVAGASEAKLDLLTKQGQLLHDGEDPEKMNAVWRKVGNDSRELARQIAKAENIVQSVAPVGGSPIMVGPSAAWGGENSRTHHSQGATSNNRALRKTERSRMEQAVWGAGLVSHRYDARQLTDEELINLHQRAQPVLALQETKRAADAARREAEQARRDAERALQEAQRARKGW